jgi:hypothetical protein
MAALAKKAEAKTGAKRTAPDPVKGSVSKSLFSTTPVPKQEVSAATGENPPLFRGKSA